VRLATTALALASGQEEVLKSLAAQLGDHPRPDHRRCDLVGEEL
jgi:hypothetical protein